MTYQRKIKHKGIPVDIYEIDLNDEGNAKPCFCRDEDTCPPKGTFDMFRCTGAPMFGSLPHFYMAEELLDGIDSGLNPDKEKHGISIYLEHVRITFIKNALQISMKFYKIYFKIYYLIVNGLCFACRFANAV